jgi:hypothetical protein
MSQVAELDLDQCIDAFTTVNNEIKRINKEPAEVTDILSADQKRHKAELDRFQRNINGIKDLIKLEVERMVCNFHFKDSALTLEPINIAYYEESITHVSPQKRRTFELLECRIEKSNGSIEYMTVVQALTLLCDEAVNLENCHIENGQGVMFIDFMRGNVQARVMKDDYKPGNGNYPFLFVIG